MPGDKMLYQITSCQKISTSQILVINFDKKTDKKLKSFDIKLKYLL